MAPSLCQSLVLLAGVAGAVTANAAPGYLKLPISKPHRGQALNKRANGVLANITNQHLVTGGLNYQITVGLGTPNPQDVTVVLDTGSSDLWVFGQGTCQDSSGCGGTFDRSDSKSLQNITGGDGLFSISYADGSQVEGDYVQDTVTIGGVQVTDFTFAVADKAKISSNTGVMGIGFNLNEAIISTEAQAGQEPDPYPDIIDTMMNQSIINSRAFSLYLDDLEASIGSIIFGGYDPSKFQGDLQILPILEDEQTGQTDSYSVSWTSLGITTPKDGSTVFQSNSLPASVVLDSGTSLVTLPQDILDQVAAIFGAEQGSGEDTGYYLACPDGSEQGTVDFGFGGQGGPIIAVPFSELAIPLVDNDGKPVTSDGKAVCAFGFEPAIDNTDLLFGDSLLRSAYVVYDQDNSLIGLAQNIFNVSGSNVQPIPSKGLPAIPSATPAPNASNVDISAPEATSDIPDDDPFTDPFGTGGDDSTPTVTSGPTASVAASGVPTSYTNRFAPSAATSVLADQTQPTGKNSGGSSGSGSGGNGKNAASALQPFDSSSLFVIVGSFGLMILGAMFTIHA